MTFSFITDAFAETTATQAAPQTGGLNMIFILVLFVAAFYFFIIRPQSKRAKAQQTLLNALQKGDEVLTTAGIFGIINHIDENIVILELNETTKIKIQKNAIVSLLPKGTIKN